eukprot:scaffold15453_cov110-Isochrysis_galbana.AAC.7
MATTWSGELFSNQVNLRVRRIAIEVDTEAHMATWGGTLAKPDLLHKPWRCCGLVSVQCST